MIDKKLGAALSALTAAALSGCAAQDSTPLALLDTVCASPPPLHCPETDCPTDLILNPGNVTDPGTGRQFFIDYPCDLKPGEKVTFVLNLHGGGSFGNWQRHYFPLLDYVDEYRLVVASPSGSDFGWVPEKDDQHLRNIVQMVEADLGRENVRAFWFAGHSFGGQTSNRLIMTDPFFSERVDGWMSLSGGRLGSKREDVRAPIPRSVPLPDQTSASDRPERPRPPMRLAAQAEVLPPKAFNFIYETGEHELTSAGLPMTSPWAAKLGCDASPERRQVTDTRAGYVYDTREQERNPVWGTTPRPGTAFIYQYGDCNDGLVVADVVRIDKGHTEGLEPEITEELVRMMVNAPPV